jgi:hypothetical protein
VAPDAGQGAAFKKHHTPDAGPVIQGIAFDIQDQWGFGVFRGHFKKSFY